MIRRLVLVEGIVLGEHAHPQFVEGRGLERPKRLFLQGITLMIPHIARGADGEVRRAIFVGEMVGIMDAHRPVVTW